MNRILILLILLVGVSFAQMTHYADSPSRDDVANKIADAAVVDGDTVVIPAGSSTWTGGITITKAITLEGSEYNTNGTNSTPSDKADDTWGTVITGAFNGSKIILSTTAGKTYRLSKIHFKSGSGDAAQFGHIQLTGSSESVIIDRLRLEKLSSSGQNFWIGGRVYGVAHDLYITGATSGSVIVFQHQQGTQFGDSAGFGDGSWENALTWGTDDAWFIENCYAVGTTSSFVLTDGWRGSRFVVRNNSLVNASVQNHGTESGQRYRGGRSVEAYYNTFNFSVTVSDAIHLRSGSLLAHNNVFSTSGGAILTNAVRLRNYRQDTDFKPWGITDGTLAWDEADTTDDGSTPGGAGDGVFETGTFTSTSSNSATDSSKSWTTNQWAGCYVRQAESFTATSGTTSGTITVTVSGASWTTNEWSGYTITKGATAYGEKGRVASNTADTLTLDATWYRPTFSGGGAFQLGRSQRIASNTQNTLTLQSNFQGNGMTLKNGVAFEIRKVTQALDQPGTGLTSDITGDGVGLNNGNPNHQDLNQALEPIYVWGNTKPSASNLVSVSPSSIRINEHYYLSSPIGYTPYTYPHPLRTDEAPDSSAPTLLAAVINGATLTLTFSETIVDGAAAQFALSSGSLSSYAGSGTTRTITVTPAAEYGDPTYTLNYTPGDIEDAAGNALASISGFVVTNETPEDPNPPSIRNPGRKAKAGRVLR